MPDLRTAATMALEALEWSWGGEPLGTKEREAIDALRAALAEQPGSIPQHERLKQMEAQRLAELEHKPHCALLQIPSRDCDCGAEPTVPSDYADSHQSAQEPTWKRTVLTIQGESVPLGLVAGNPLTFRCPNCASLEAQNTELDRKLADRKPLTDEQLQKIVGNVADIGGAMRIARAIERAHGIGGQDE